MKTNKNEVSPIEKFQKELSIMMGKYYHMLLSERAQVVWKKRKEIAKTKKLAM